MPFKLKISWQKGLDFVMNFIVYVSDRYLERSIDIFLYWKDWLGHHGSFLHSTLNIFYKFQLVLSYNW